MRLSLGLTREERCNSVSVWEIFNALVSAAG